MRRHAIRLLITGLLAVAIYVGSKGRSHANSPF